MSPSPSGDSLFGQAEGAEASYDFQRASTLFLQAYAVYRSSGDQEARATACLFRAGLCIEKSQDWRADSAVWEHLGDLLGESLGDRYVKRDQPGQSDMFQVIATNQWDDPYYGYYAASAQNEAVRHRQAWAYLFAARSSEAAGDFEQAVREYRKSAVAWELSSWGERGHCLTSRTGTPTSRTELIIDDEPGVKWRLAARCYFRAAYCTIHAYEPRVSERLSERYTLKAVRVVSLHMGSSGASVTQAASDLERMERCWSHALELTRLTRQEAGAGAQEVNALQCRQLLVLEEALVQAGRRREAKQIYVKRQDLLYRHGRSRLEKCMRFMYIQTTGAGSSVTRTLLSSAVVYVVLFPLMLWALGAVLLSPEPTRPPTYLQAVLFSLASILTLNLTSVTASGSLGDWLQVLEGISAYFVLGYVLWLVLRWHGE